MKRPLLIIALLLLSSPALSIPAGSSVTIATIDSCDSLQVHVTGSLDIHTGEYHLVGCEEVANDSWQCDCSDGYALRLETLPNAINNYTFEVDYNHSNGSGEFSETVESTGSSGSRDGLDNVGPITVVTDDDSDDEEPVADEIEGESEGLVGDEAPAAASGTADEEPDAGEAAAEEESSEAPQATGAVTGGDAGGLDPEWTWLFGALGLVLVLFGVYGVARRRQR